MSYIELGEVNFNYIWLIVLLFFKDGGYMNKILKNTEGNIKNASKICLEMMYKRNEFLQEIENESYSNQIDHVELDEEFKKVEDDLFFSKGSSIRIRLYFKNCMYISIIWTENMSYGSRKSLWEVAAFEKEGGMISLYKDSLVDYPDVEGFCSNKRVLELIKEIALRRISNVEED